ncbi:TRAP transporter small permease [Cellulosilyticum sp. I15G10I2]|uniref:TRAP transporter small permease n=1 Tax=Cellulosilyticum sp. I15G10I2 TaxID=1892843 RepID=UPI00085CCCBD|nr:TRAP transporter small permease [Cellulosilyticum sp. I15G10I2]
MDNVKKIGKKVIDFLGITVPTITFLIIFITFMIGIISRYVLRQPVPWTYEISILAYMWTMFFGVGQAIRLDEHVVFGLVYDSASEKVQKIFRVIYNLAVAILVTIAFMPCLNSMLSKRGITGVLQLPYKWVFAPFLLMFIEIILRCAYNVIKEFMLQKKEEVK